MKKKRHETIAQWLQRRIGDLGKPQKDIAREVGWPKPNVVTMIKQGTMRVPLDKVGPLAKSLELDPVELFWNVIREYAPDTYDVLDKECGGVILKEHERKLIQVHPDIIGDREVTDISVAEDRKSFAVHFVVD